MVWSGPRPRWFAYLPNEGRPPSQKTPRPFASQMGYFLNPKITHDLPARIQHFRQCGMQSSSTLNLGGLTQILLWLGWAQYNAGNVKNSLDLLGMIETAPPKLFRNDDAIDWSIDSSVWWLFVTYKFIRSLLMALTTSVLLTLRGTLAMTLVPFPNKA